MALPARFGGLGIFNPVEKCKINFEYSTELCHPLVSLIKKQADSFDPSEVHADQKAIKDKQEFDLEYRHGVAISTLSMNASKPLQRAIAVARQKGASSWVTAMPSEEHDTVLHKGDFLDALYIRYGWDILDLPEKCVCGEAFNVQHSLDCPIGGYRALMHNEVRDLVAECLKEARYHAVEPEPDLQPLTGETFKLKSVNTADDARSDVKCVGFWRKLRQAYFDIKVVSPFARSNLNKSHGTLYHEAENTKKREYQSRINGVEHADFTPLVFTTAGGMAPQMQLFLKRVSQKISQDQDIANSVVAGWLRCRFSFALLRTTLICLRGTRKKKYTPHLSELERAVHDSRVEL